MKLYQRKTGLEESTGKIMLVQILRHVIITLRKNYSQDIPRAYFNALMITKENGHVTQLLRAS